MNQWQRYRSSIEARCISPGIQENSMTFWRDKLFAITVSFALPLSLIAIIPGVYISILGGLYGVVYFDIFAITGLIIIGHSPGMTVVWRKLFFCFILYAAGIVLLYFLGYFGPGFIYLLAISIFMVIIYPNKFAFSSFFINIVICFGFGLAIYNGYLIDRFSNNSNVLPLQSWVANSANLLFLSAVFSFLIPKLSSGLQASLLQQDKLKKELDAQKQDLEKLNIHLKDKNKELEQFAYIASHDLQEPLRMVTGFLSQLDKKYSPQLDEKAQQYIFLAVDGAKRMRQIIVDLLEFSRAGKSEESRVEIDLNHLVDDVVALQKNIIDEKNAVVRKKDLPVVKGYKSMLLQVFQNLINNALKYSKPDQPPEITISCESLNGSWNISISDNGIGIEEKYFEQIFKIFNRLHPKDVYEGTGLGLAIVKKVIEPLGGSIWVESEIGIGSTFFITLPK